MKREKLSKHVLDERMERFYLITTTIGFGERVLRVVRDIHNPGAVACLTETGVVVVRAGNENGMIITAFVPDIRRIKAEFFRGESIPYWLENVIRKNMKRKEFKTI